MPAFRFLLLCALLLLGHSRIHAAAPDLQKELVAYLPMRTDLKDHSPFRHPVEVSGRVQLRDGAAWFGGKEDWLELPHIALNERPFAVAVWLKPTGAKPTYGVLEQWDRSTNGRILHLMIRNGLRPWLGFYNNDVVSPVSLSNGGAWQHVVFQYDGIWQQIWINGRLVCRRAAEAYHGTSGLTCIGKNPNWNNVPGRDYEGWMSDLRIYSRALSFEEISALAAQSPAPISSNLASNLANTAIAQPAGSIAPAGTSAVPLLSIDANKMRISGRPGDEYSLEASEDLTNWEVLGTLTVDPYGIVDFLDIDAARYRQRFYRVRFNAPQ